MAQLTLYLDDATSKALDKAAKRDGMSRSAWAREALQAKLPPSKWPAEWLAALGTWSDDRTVEQFLADIEDTLPLEPVEPLN